MKSIRIIVSSDTHGAVLDHQYADGKKAPMGLCRLSTHLKQSRQSHDVIAIDNGDALQGTPLLTYLNQHNKHPHLLAEVFNVMQVNHYNLGNHDFNYGPEVLLNFIQSMNGKCLTSNVLYQDKPLGETIIETIQGVNIGLIGVVTDYIPNWEKPEHIKDFKFLDVLTTVKTELAKIRHQVDIVVVVYHGGIEKDLLTHQETERYTKENVGYQLAYLEGVDLCFTGHQHRSINTQTTQALTLQCAQNATEVMQVDIDPTTKQALGQLVPMTLPPDSTIEELVQHQEKLTQEWLDQPIGEFSQPYLITDQKQARINKHPIVSFINHVQLKATQAQLSVTSLFNHATGFNQIVTKRDLVSTYVYPNTLVVKAMSGHQIKAMLEQCANYFIINDQENIDINTTYQYPKPQHFNYDMMDGLQYTINVSQPIGSRITSMSIDGEPFDLDKTYTVAMNNYRAVGGGDFEMVAQAETINDTNQDMVDILSEYIQTHSPITINHHQNIHVMK